ncbi:MAG: hypothetical protein ACPG5W_03800, partial [Flavobacteriales bacterium]
KQIPVYGVFINSSKRKKSGADQLEGSVEYSSKTEYVRGRYSCELENDGTSFRLCIDGSIQGTAGKFSEGQAWVNELFLQSLIDSGAVG